MEVPLFQRTMHIVLSFVLLATVTLVLTGTTGCSLPAREPGECQVTSDCSHGLQPNCEGEWSCLDSACTFICNTEPNLCTSDADCGPNTFCEYTNCTDEECSGLCKEWSIPPSCSSDVDCALGYVCNLCATASCPVCEDCLPACVPDPKPINYCWSDADCSGTQICAPTSVTRISSGSDGMPDLPLPKGECIDAPEPECFSDADCLAGQVCTFMDSLPANSPDIGCVEPPVMSGVCTAVPETECWNDSDCVAGQVCFFAATGDGCSEDEDCSLPESGRGMCGDAPLDGCSNDNDCPSGSICDPCGTTSCPSCPDCIPACIQVELLTAYCTDDADCSDGQKCAYGSDMPVERDAETDCGANTPDYGICIGAADTSA